MDSSRLSPGWEWGDCPDEYQKAIKTIAEVLMAITQNNYSGMDELKKATTLLVESKLQHSFFIEWNAVDYERHEHIICKEFIER